MAQGGFHCHFRICGGCRPCSRPVFLCPLSDAHSFPTSAPLSTLPAGFELAIKAMKPGGKRRIVVPPELGPPVGPATFFSAKQYEVFDVELRSVKTCT